MIGCSQIEFEVERTTAPFDDTDDEFLNENCSVMKLIFQRRRIEKLNDNSDHLW